MTRLGRVSKFIVAALIPIAQLIQAALSDDTITTNEWVKIGIAAVGALGVFAIPNAPPPPPKRPPVHHRYKSVGGHPSGDTPASDLPPPKRYQPPPPPPVPPTQ